MARPDYAESILVALLLTALTVIIHAVGTSWWIRRLKRRMKVIAVDDQFAGLKILCSTATLLLALHIVEVIVWAMTFLILPDVSEVKTLEEAVYFSTVTFTSLGYGDVVIARPWRLLAAIEAMTGLLIFGWSTALVIAVVERLWNSDATE
jgi:voltage-gated potassium channel Kch